MPNKIKLIIFDFDGTLGDTRRNIVTTMQMTIAEHQLPYRHDIDRIEDLLKIARFLHCEVEE